jgi:dienelactone hydrolase
MASDLPTEVFEHAGARLEGRLARPGKLGMAPAVLVMPSAQGLGEHVQEVARRLAEEGYVALAVDMYGNGVHFSNPEGCGPSIIPLMQDPQLLRARLTGWLQQLCALPEVDARRVAAIGYCFGGQCALELARSGADIRAAISYHGLLSTALPAQTGAVRAKIAIYSGARDPWAPRQDVIAFEDEMRKAGASWQITVFGDARHAFTMEEDAAMPLEGLGYDALADAQSWAGTLTLLRHVLS